MSVIKGQLGKETSKATANNPLQKKKKPAEVKAKSSKRNPDEVKKKLSDTKEIKTQSSVSKAQSTTSSSKKTGKAQPRRSKKVKKVSRLKKIAIGFSFLCCVFLLWCGYLIWLMNASLPDREPVHANAGIILGAALWRDEPSPALRERLIKAVDLYNSGKVDYLILSGGTGGLLSTLSEAEGMRNFLINKGIPEDKLLLEPQSVNTFQNLWFSQKIVEDKQFESVIIITHDYHLPRAMEIAKYLNLQSVQGSAVHSQVLSPLYNQTREMLSLTKWKLEWLLLQVGILSPESIK